MPSAKRSGSESGPSCTSAHLTCREGASDKFYEITTRGCDVCTRYGRRGAAGVATSKTFDTVEQAAAFAARTIAEKLRKGYAHEEAEAATATTATPRIIPDPAAKPASKTVAIAVARQPFAGMTFCITGHLSVLRADVEAEILARGGKMTKTVTHSTTHLVCAQQGTKKCEDARSKGITVVDESWVRALLPKASSLIELEHKDDKISASIPDEIIASNPRKKSKGSRHVFELTSGEDGLSTALDIGPSTLMESEFLGKLLNTSAIGSVVIPAGTKAIAALCSLLECPELNRDISAEVKSAAAKTTACKAAKSAVAIGSGRGGVAVRTGDPWFHVAMQSLGLDRDCALFASVFKVADFLGMISLAEVLRLNLEYPRPGHELERLEACVTADVPLSRMLFKRLGLDDEASASALFDKLLKAPSADLSYHDLELCDGLFLRAPQHCSLGLVAWTKRERARRSTIAKHSLQLNASARASIKSVSDRQILNQKLWNAVEAGDLSAAKSAFSMGACADLFFEGRRGDVPMLFSEYLSMGEFEYHGKCEDILPEDMREIMSTLMMATQKNDLNMMNWLLDVGCDVNGAQPDSYIYGDGFNFGGMTALAFTTSIESMNLLLSRGANATATYTPPQYESDLQARSTLVGHLQIMRSKPNLRDAMAMSLIRHGANANDVGYPCFSLGQSAGPRYTRENAPTSYWPGVVMKGDVDRAKELLQLHDADPNWPSDVSLEALNDNLYGLGATVLQMAVLTQNKAMVELLLDHGADVNCSEQIFVNFDMYQDHGAEDVAEIAFLCKDKCLHYWGSCSIDEMSGICVPEEKKATALSVALGNGCCQDIISTLVQAGASDRMIKARSKYPVMCVDGAGSRHSESLSLSS